VSQADSPDRKARLPVRAYNALGRVRRALRPPPHFADSEPALLDAAARQVGFDDFGPEPFREGLRVLLRAYDEEARLSPFGRMLVGQELAGILAARLSVEKARAEHPELFAAEVRRPLFILGLPRSGTTALHFLLAQDPGNQVLEYWIAGAPGPRPPRATWEGDPRFKAALRALRTMYYLDPTLKAIHLMTADGPDECRHLFLQSFLDHTFDSNASIPSYTKWFAQQDMRPAYERHRDVLRWIGSTSPERRWVLKYPAHMRELRTLLQVYPDACIVQTHRDPVKVLPSICSLVAGWRGLYEESVERTSLGAWQLDMYAGMVEETMAVRDACDPAQFFDLSFDEVVGDPVAAVERIYRHFGFDRSQEAERRMREWLAENPQGKHGAHFYSPELFGLSSAEVADRFARYVERYGVRRETER
jgi:hypothetical protein